MAYWDLITYCKDTKALMAEVAKVVPNRLIKDEQSNPVGFAIDKTPTIRNGTETLAVVRVTDEELAVIQGLKSLQVLAQVSAGGDLLAAMVQAERTIYDRVYPRTPVPVQDETGQVIGQYTPPELIGAFA